MPRGNRISQRSMEGAFPHMQLRLYSGIHQVTGEANSFIPQRVDGIDHNEGCRQAPVRVGQPHRGRLYVRHHLRGISAIAVCRPCVPGRLKCPNRTIRARLHGAFLQQRIDTGF